MAAKSEKTNRVAELHSGGGKWPGKWQHHRGSDKRFFQQEIHWHYGICLVAPNVSLSLSLPAPRVIDCSDFSGRGPNKEPGSEVWESILFAENKPSALRTSCFSDGSRRQDCPRLQFKQVSSDTALNTFFYIKSGIRYFTVQEKRVCVYIEFVVICLTRRRPREVHFPTIALLLAFRRGRGQHSWQIPLAIMRLARVERMTTISVAGPSEEKKKSFLSDVANHSPPQPRLDATRRTLNSKLRLRPSELRRWDAIIINPTCSKNKTIRQDLWLHLLAVRIFTLFLHSKWCSNTEQTLHPSWKARN